MKRQFGKKSSSAVSIIGGADEPTSVFVAGEENSGKTLSGCVYITLKRKSLRALENSGVNCKLTNWKRKLVDSFGKICLE